MSVRGLVVGGIGLHCAEAAAFALTLAGAEARIIRAPTLCQQPDMLFDSDIVVIPGGFSFGDVGGAGATLAALFSKAELDVALQLFASNGGLVLGICNGCQLLCRLGLVGGNGTITIEENVQRQFVCDWRQLHFVSHHSPWLDGGAVTLTLPIAHRYGRLGGANDSYVIARYVDDGAIAALSNDNGRIVAMMPHPERAIRHTPHHGISPQGLWCFTNAVAYVRRQQQVASPRAVHHNRQ